MIDDIRVSVVEFGDRAHYQLQWRDPVSGRKKTKSSGIERTGRKRERDLAERVAAKLEKDLREGVNLTAGKMTWAAFRERHEAEVQPSLSGSSQRSHSRAFDLVEEILEPKLLRELTAEAISKWVAKLQEGYADASVGLYIARLRASLNWAADMEFIREAPKIRVPKGANEARPKGRPLTLEEHERMLAAIEKVVKDEAQRPAWRLFLNGLWWSGLRLSEALALSWEPTEDVSVSMQAGCRPMLKFTAKGHKARRAETIPCAPEFAQLLEAIPGSDRTGKVFHVRGCQYVVSERITALGKAAKIVANPETGKPATAHDYRRSFGTRWARRVMPAILQKLMRHKQIQTTLGFYVTQTAEDMAADLWAAFEKLPGNTLGNTRPETLEKTAES